MTSSDLLRSQSDPSLAARIMRDHRIHHVLVTHEKKLVGLVSTFDRLQLVEDHRFTMQSTPSENCRQKGARAKAEQRSTDPA